MPKLFLASLFHQCSSLLPAFLGDPRGLKACFIPTAGFNDTETWYIDNDRLALEALGLTVDVLEVSTAPAADIPAKIEAADIIFVTGGNTFFLAQELRRSGADKLILGHIASSKPYVATSAGSIVLAKDIAYARHMDPVEEAPLLNGDFRGLGAVDFCVAPHKAYSPFKEACRLIEAEYGGKLDIVYLDDDEAVTVDGDHRQVVSIKSPL
jgi:dipeptidase E